MLKNTYNLLAKPGYYNLPHMIFLKLFLPYVAYKNKHKFNDLNNSIVVTGMPRGGTTWLGELLHHIPNTIYFREPLKLGNLKHLDKLNFSWRQFIPDNAEWPEAKKFFNQLLQGGLITPALIDRYHYIPDILKAENLLFKFVRLNQSLPWLVEQFPQLRPVYIVRHPCAVVYSQMNHGAWGFTKNITFPHSFKTSEHPYSAFYKKFEDILPKAKTVEELLTIGWCFDCLPLFHRNNNKKWLTISYEEAIQDKPTFIRNIFHYIQKDIPDTIWKTLDKPSTSVQNQNNLLDNKAQLSKWKDKLSKEQIDRILNIVNIFGIEHYDENPEPDYNKIINYTFNPLFINENHN